MSPGRSSPEARRRTMAAKVHSSTGEKQAMTQAQHTHHGTTISIVPLAIAGVAMTAVLGIALAVSQGVPSFGSGGATVQDVDQRLTQMGRDWQAQREAQGGFTDLYTQLGTEWEAQRAQTSTGVGPVEAPRLEGPILPAPN